MKTITNKKENLQANISISRVSVRDEDGYVSITLNDETSRDIVIEVKMDFKSFAEALTGLGFRDCSYTIFDTYEKLGRTKEFKTETIKFPEYHSLINYDDNNQLIFTVEGLKVYESLVSPFEDGGWKADMHSVLKVSGKYDGTTAIKSVIFTRYI